METREQHATGKPVLERISDRLLEAQQELDELAVQFALGKAEARDKFEEIKTSFKSYVTAFKSKLNQGEVHQLTQQLRSRIDELELQLALGKVETKELFEEQRKKIMDSLTAFEDALNRSLPALVDVDVLYHEIEKFKLKLEIIRLKFVLKKFSIKDSFRERMKESRLKVTKLTDQLNANWESGNNKLSNLKDEIQLAYRHLRKAIKSF
jgi:hypothetical protein